MSFLGLLALTWIVSGWSGVLHSPGGEDPLDASPIVGASDGLPTAEGDDHAQKPTLTSDDLFDDSFGGQDGSGSGSNLIASTLTQTFPTDDNDPFDGKFLMDFGPGLQFGGSSNTGWGAGGGAFGAGGFGGLGPVASSSGGFNGSQGNGPGGPDQLSGSGANSNSSDDNGNANGGDSNGGDSTGGNTRGGNSSGGNSNGGDSNGGDSGSNLSISFVPSNDLTGDPNDTTTIPVISDNGPDLFPGGSTLDTPLGDDVPPAAVPEPESLVLLGTGLIVVARRFRRVTITT